MIAAVARTSVLPRSPIRRYFEDPSRRWRSPLRGIQGARHVRIYLPRGYEATHAHRALYMFDGQNMFDDAPSYAGGWHLNDAVDRLATKTRRAPVVVGIDHGGEKRIDELSPFAVGSKSGHLDAFLDGVIASVMPLVAQHAHIGMGPVFHAVGGSSLGGLAAFYAHFRRPDVFGGAIAISPSFWLARKAIFDWVRSQQTPAITRIYLGTGGAREGQAPMATRFAESMAQQLSRGSARGYTADNLMWLRDPKGSHREADWRRQGSQVPC